MIINNAVKKMEFVTTEQLRKKFGNYRNPDTKIERACKNGEFYRIKRGLYGYGNGKGVYKEAVSSMIYGPSYVSFEDALSRYGLIPEKVTECSCATLRKQRSMVFKNGLGYYSFTNIPAKAFPYGVVLYEKEGYQWNMATPEKAVCDLLYTRKTLDGPEDVLRFLIDGMRIEEEDFFGLDIEKMSFFAGLYNNRNLKMLKEVL